MKGCKLYDPITRKFIRSREVVFLEGKFHDFGTKSLTSLFTDYPQYHGVHVEIPRNQTEETGKLGWSRKVIHSLKVSITKKFYPLLLVTTR